MKTFSISERLKGRFDSSPRNSSKPNTMKRMVETTDTLIPPAQLQIVREALSLMVHVLKNIESDHAQMKLFDCTQLKAMMNYPVYVDIPEEDKKNFAYYLHGMDFPQYVYDKKETFFLFGMDAVSLYKKHISLGGGSLDWFLSQLSNIEYDVFCYTEGYNDASDLLAEFKGWTGYTTIPKEVYVAIINA